jgi:hypothetical protein
LDDMAASIERLTVMSRDINKELDVQTVYVYCKHCITYHMSPSLIAHYVLLCDVLVHYRMLSDLDMEMDTAEEGFALTQKRLERLINATDSMYCMICAHVTHYYLASHIISVHRIICDTSYCGV